jgi:uncharacterized protein
MAFDFSSLQVLSAILIASAWCLGSLFVVLPLLLASLARRFHSNSMRTSALCVGRVWHARLTPKRHAFSYPIFMFAIDLEELESFRSDLWPLSPFVVSFRTNDHLKNGEGAATSCSRASAEGSASSSGGGGGSMASRILRLVEERTRKKFQPTLATHRVVILTHLRYYGYNFNPVSFYYVLDRSTGAPAAVVGEVSNTPWCEMHCYVLHPDSVDQVETETTNIEGGRVKVGYTFPKAFHVSPFMEMEYWYDWSFVGVPGLPSTSESERVSSSIIVVNTLRSRVTDEIAFTARLVMECRRITPLGVAWQMIRLPAFCIIIQVWIHYQAAILFLKGIVYVQHPQGSETAASRIIAGIMTPFFAVRDYVHPKSKTA